MYKSGVVSDRGNCANEQCDAPLLEDVLGRINRLRKKSRWVEFLAQHSMVRNIAGYTQTRWCSACECLESFYEVRTIVLEYQRAGPCL